MEVVDIPVTKYRRRCITGAMLERICNIAAQRSRGGGEHAEINGQADHVHLLVSLPPNLDLSRLVNNLKGRRREFDEPDDADTIVARVAHDLELLDALPS
jgi:REP element-mobilizing transposase RayT